MGYRVARMVLLGLLIVLPLVVRAASPPSWSGRQEGAWWPAAPIACAEVVLLGGLLVADWNRRRLLAECLRQVDRARTQREVGRPAAMRFFAGATRTRAADTLSASG
jgi:hypothetical protein